MYLRIIGNFYLEYPISLFIDKKFDKGASGGLRPPSELVVKKATVPCRYGSPLAIVSTNCISKHRLYFVFYPDNHMN